MTLSSGSNTVLNWLSDLTSIATFISWAFICVSFLRFKSACDAQGIIRSESKYIYNRFQPFPAYWALFWCIITIFFNGYKVFLKGRWNTSSFIIAYINIPIVGALFLGHYLFTKRPSFKPASKIDMVSNIPGPEIDFDPNPPTTKIGKFLRWLL
nr:amino acid permease [Phaffia rhodozyma]